MPIFERKREKKLSKREVKLQNLRNEALVKLDSFKNDRAYEISALKLWGRELKNRYEQLHKLQVDLDGINERIKANQKRRTALDKNFKKEIATLLSELADPARSVRRDYMTHARTEWLTKNVGEHSQSVSPREFVLNYLISDAQKVNLLTHRVKEAFFSLLRFVYGDQIDGPTDRENFFMTRQFIEEFLEKLKQPDLPDEVREANCAVIIEQLESNFKGFDWYDGLINLFNLLVSHTKKSLGAHELEAKIKEISIPEAHWKNADFLLDQPRLKERAIYVLKQYLKKIFQENNKSTYEQKCQKIKLSELMKQLDALMKKYEEGVPPHRDGNPNHPLHKNNVFITLIEGKITDDSGKIRFLLDRDPGRKKLIKMYQLVSQYALKDFDDRGFWDELNKEFPDGTTVRKIWNKSQNEFLTIGKSETIVELKNCEKELQRDQYIDNAGFWDAYTKVIKKDPSISEMLQAVITESKNDSGYASIKDLGSNLFSTLDSLYVRDTKNYSDGRSGSPASPTYEARLDQLLSELHKKDIKSQKLVILIVAYTFFSIHLGEFKDKMIPKDHLDTVICRLLKLPFQSSELETKIQGGLLPTGAEWVRWKGNEEPFRTVEMRLDACTEFELEKINLMKDFIKTGNSVNATKSGRFFHKLFQMFFDIEYGSKENNLRALDTALQKANKSLTRGDAEAALDIIKNFKITRYLPGSNADSDSLDTNVQKLSRDYDSAALKKDHEKLKIEKNKLVGTEKLKISFDTIDGKQVRIESREFEEGSIQRAERAYTELRDQIKPLELMLNLLQQQVLHAYQAFKKQDGVPYFERRRHRNTIHAEELVSSICGNSSLQEGGEFGKNIALSDALKYLAEFLNRPNVRYKDHSFTFYLLMELFKDGSGIFATRLNQKALYDNKNETMEVCYKAYEDSFKAATPAPDGEEQSQVSDASSTERTEPAAVSEVTSNNSEQRLCDDKEKPEDSLEKYYFSEKSRSRVCGLFGDNERKGKQKVRSNVKNLVEYREGGTVVWCDDKVIERHTIFAARNELRLKATEAARELSETADLFTGTRPSAPPAA